MAFVIHINIGDGEALCGRKLFRGAHVLGRHARDEFGGVRCAECVREWEGLCRVAVRALVRGALPIGTPHRDAWFALECEEVVFQGRRYLATPRAVLLMRDGESRDDALRAAECLP